MNYFAMSHATVELPNEELTPHLPQAYRWSVDAFHALQQGNFLPSDQRLELIAGELIHMAPIGSDHASKVKRLNYHLTAQIGGKIIVSVQDPVRLDEYSELQPDIALLRWRDDFYQHANPKAEDVLLIIEVADSSANYDRTVKIPLYARHNIPEVWLLDLIQKRLEAYQKPDETGEYSTIRFYRSGQVAPILLPDCSLALGEFFPS